MRKITDITKAYRSTGALHENISVFGFLDDSIFFAKNGDVGVVLKVQGVDYECLDTKAIDHLSKRLESAFKLFDPRFRVYQYLFKSNKPEVPFRPHPNEVVNEVLSDRAEHFSRKAESLYTLDIYYVITFEGFRHTPDLTSALTRLASGVANFSGPKCAAAWSDIGAAFGTNKRITLIEEEIHRAQQVLALAARNFIVQVNDFVQVEVLNKQDAFQMLRRLLNYSPAKRQSSPLKYNTNVDYFLSDSSIECYSDHLLVDGYVVKVLTLKEASSRSWPLIFKHLYEIGANYHVALEWNAIDNTTARAKIQSKRRHFNNSSTSLASQAAENADSRHILVDESMLAQVGNLGSCLTELEMKGNYFGAFTMTIVIYDKSFERVEKACGEFYKVFSMNDGSVYEERYNLFNALFATLPANTHFNLRSQDILNTNYADYSFLFTLHTGDKKNPHLKTEYLALLETTQNTPYYLNLHYLDTAHTILVGRTGSGKSFLLNFLIANAQKYDPYTFIFDLGGSYQKLSQLFGGTYTRIGTTTRDFTINPFALEPTESNMNFLFHFVKVLIEGQGQHEMTTDEERDLHQQLENIYKMGLHLRTMSTLASMLRKDLRDRLHKWVKGGQYEQLFDNEKDTLTFNRFQCFDFEGMDQYPQLIEPLLFYILHRATTVISDPAISTVFKTFFIDEAWRFFQTPTIRAFIIESMRTWRKKNGAMILATQSIDELRQSEILDIVLESCATKIFLANPDMDKKLYSAKFHLNDTEISLIEGLVPKKQFLIKQHKFAKVLNLNVDPKTYQICTNNPYDNKRWNDAYAKYGFKRALEILAQGESIDEPLQATAR